MAALGRHEHERRVVGRGRLAHEPLQYELAAFVHRRDRFARCSDVGTAVERIDLVQAPESDLLEDPQRCDRGFVRLSDLGLHVQFHMDVRELSTVLPSLKNWKLPVVIDHFCSAKAAAGASDPAFLQLRKQLAEGRVWIKMSGTYRISARYPDYPDARPLHEALLAANPDQLLWGTDWPHPRLAKNMPDTGHLLDLFNAWTPSADIPQIAQAIDKKLWAEQGLEVTVVPFPTGR